MANQMTGSEHRWGERITVNIPVQLSAHPLTGVHGCIKDISLSGALVKTDADLRLRSLIKITMQLPPPLQRAGIVMARIARKIDGDVGVEWCEFAPLVIKDLLHNAARRSSV